MADMNTRLQRYNRWVGKLNPAHKKVKVVEAGSHGLGVRARVPISVGDVLANTSVDDCIHLGTIRHDPAVWKSPELTALYSELTQQSAISLYLLHNVRNYKHRFNPWMQVLSLFPENHTHRLLFWTQEALEALEPASAIEYVKYTNDSLYKEYRAFRDAIDRHPGALPSDMLDEGGPLSYPYFLSARMALESRYWGRDKNLFIVAGADFYNHALSAVEQAWTPDDLVDQFPKNNIWNDTDRDDMRAVLYADSPAKKGGIVTDSYLTATGGFFFLSHSFVPDGPNPQFCYEILTDQYTPMPDRAKDPFPTHWEGLSLEGARGALHGVFARLQTRTYMKHKNMMCLYGDEVCPSGLMLLTLGAMTTPSDTFVQNFADGVYQNSIERLAKHMHATYEGEYGEWNGTRVAWRSMWRRVMHDREMYPMLVQTLGLYRGALIEHLRAFYTTSLESDERLLRERMQSDGQHSDVPMSTASRSNPPTFAVRFRVEMKRKLIQSIAATKREVDRLSAAMMDDDEL